MKDYVNRYMPALYKENNEMKGLYGTEKDLFTEVDEVRRELYSNLFVSTANLDAIKTYEKEYNILADSSLTLEQRRQNVINELIFKPPFTRQRFGEILAMYYGEGNYAYTIYPETFSIMVDVKIEDPEVYETFNRMLRRIIPSNMTLLFAVPYMYLYLERNCTYQALETEHTYGDLSQFSNYEIT